MSGNKHTYPVREIFYSLQGEGFHTGKPAVFVRFAGCNLSCDFCDTDHTSQVRHMTADEIVNEASGYDSKHIVLTGGEPALWVDERLIKTFRNCFPWFYIQVETNGTIDNPSFAMVNWVTCSPKKSPRVISHVDELKVVMLDQPGFDPHNYRLEYMDTMNLFLQPMSCTNTQKVIEYLLQNPNWRLSLQTHKYLNIE